MHLVWEEGTGGDVWPLPLAERTDVLTAGCEGEEGLKRALEFIPHPAGSEAVCCSLHPALSFRMEGQVTVVQGNKNCRELHGTDKIRSL